jgi:hypothetical integral membrane protein (TIGR02206 family)
VRYNHPTLYLEVRMKLTLRHLAIAAALVLVSTDVMFYFLDYAQTAIKLAEPVGGKTLPRTFTVEGNAWDKQSSDLTIEIDASNSTGQTMTQEAPRDAVRYDGQIAFYLTSFETQFTVPSDGEWRVTGVLVRTDGTRLESAPRRVTVSEGAGDTTFVAFSPLHAAGAGVVLLAALFVAFYFPKRAGPTARRVAETVISGGLWLNELVYRIYWYTTGGWMVTNSMIIQMCGLSILLLTVVFTLENERVRHVIYEIIFFWGIGGALQALIAPDIGTRSFPDYRFFSFFISHGLIIVGGVYVVAGRGFRPTFRSVVRIFIITNIAVVVTWGFNMLLTVVPPYQVGNYFMTGYPPPTGSIIDLFAQIFGPAPRYLVGLELMGAVVFVLLWAPFGLVRLTARCARTRW